MKAFHVCKLAAGFLLFFLARTMGFSGEKPADDKARMRKLLTIALRYGTNPWHNPSVDDLSTLFKKHPEEAVSLLREALNKCDLTERSGLDRARRGVQLFGRFRHMVALRELDFLYRKWQGGQLRCLRVEAVASLRASPVLFRKGHVPARTKEAVAVLKRWMGLETDGKIMGQGLRILSGYESQLPPRIMERAKELMPPRELTFVKRRLALNGVKDPTTICREALSWLDEFIDQAEQMKNLWVSVGGWNEEVLQFLFRKLRQNKSEDGDFVEQLRKRSSRCKTVLERLPGKLREATASKDPSVVGKLRMLDDDVRFLRRCFLSRIRQAGAALTKEEQAFLTEEEKNFPAMNVPKVAPQKAP